MRPLARLGPPLLVAALLGMAGCVAYPADGYAPGYVPGYYAAPSAVVVGGGWGYRSGGWGYPRGSWGNRGNWGHRGGWAGHGGAWHGGGGRGGWRR